MKQHDRTVTYLDYAATSWIKPEGVIDAVCDMLRGGCANPGRSGHRLSIDTARSIFSVRDAAARLLGSPDPLRVVFTANATVALNMAITGLVAPGDHVITSSMEHNSVMRPLRALEARGAAITVVPCDPCGVLDPQNVEEAIRPSTKLIILTHASNVTGTLLPVEEVAEIARDRGVLLCVDAAQTVGSIPLDVKKSGIDLLAFTGHKSLYGPQGTGGLYLREGLEERVEPVLRGGTGSLSEREEQPRFMPDRFESGTPNSPGIAGLGAGIDFVMRTGIPVIHEQETGLLKRFLSGLSHLKKIVVHGTADPERMVPIVSITIPGVSPSTASQVLDEEFAIMTRPGLHCAPAAHRTMGTYPAGTVRFSLGWFTTEEDIDSTLNALEAISG